MRIADPRLHTLEVEARVPCEGSELRFAIPAWTPGSYLLREFARYLGEPRATVRGREAAATKIAKGTWSVPCEGADHVVVTYSVYGHELTVRTPHIDGSHAYFLGSNALIYVPGRLDSPARVRVEAPAGWTVFCPLATDGEGWFGAPDYDVLADAPFEVGPHRSHTVEVLGVPHRLVFWGDDAVDLDLTRLERDIAAIVEANAQLFGGRLPYDNYDFVFHITASARGGLEHLNSTVLATPWRYFDTDEGYAELLGLISHEHFHTWNVKRIRPRALGPFDYQSENHTTALWVAEGFTSYFDALMCLRSGVIDAKRYFTWLARDIKRLHSVPGRHRQSLAQSSWDAWIRLYRPDEDTPNRTVSYYLKGSLVSLALDLSLRQRSGGKRSLDEVIGALWDDFCVDGAGFDELGIPDVIERATGIDLADEVQRWVFDTDEPDLAALLESHGMALEANGKDEAWLGIDTEGESGAIVVKHVLAGGPAEGSDIAPGDTLLAVDGRRVDRSSLGAVTARLRAGREVVVHGFRRDRLYQTRLVPAPAPKLDYEVLPLAAPSATQKSLYEAWTRREWVGRSS